MWIRSWENLGIVLPNFVAFHTFLLHHLIMGWLLSPCGPSFFFLENICNYSTCFLFKQDSTLILFIGFHSNFQEFYELNFQRENRPKCVKKLSFPNWHTRRIFVPYTSLLRSIQSKASILFSLFQKWVECVQIKGILDVGWPILGKTVTCVLQVVMVRVTL